MAGLDPVKLRNPKSREAWLICEIPESQIAQVKQGMQCNVTFTAFGDQQFKGVVDGMGAAVDKVTRMIKLRVILGNPSNQFQVGMFANVSFLLKEGSAISVPITAIINVQGKDYVFVKTSANTFERRDVLVGQQLDDRAVVLHGINENEDVVSKGAMQMKGISFGY
jgi:RND family efflux transporter MFP subunit